MAVVGSITREMMAGPPSRVHTGSRDGAHSARSELGQPSIGAGQTVLFGMISQSAR
ncbi:hypothetical protein Ae706Ps2_0885c [Pseudonocardia sp. Ae706_Ps2]|nr:hypothetical protein Ae505Ps2_4652 [Pseudonocardia sp. Ae505_Ps2]OLM22453.1 hypothetical protein Ae706Ps2_0885c [Pseudonocardia sp. Ae706_Ps2]